MIVWETPRRESPIRSFQISIYPKGYMINLVQSAKPGRCHLQAMHVAGAYGTHLGIVCDIANETKAEKNEAAICLREACEEHAKFMREIGVAGFD